MQQYVAAVLNRYNPYTGKQYKNDPTIVMWETGNELGAYIGREGYPPTEWTANIVDYIKSIAPNQLVLDGTDGFYK